MFKLFGVLAFLGLLAVLCLSSAPASANQTFAFISAYKLQEQCFVGSPRETQAAARETAFCSGYVLGALDTIYGALAHGGKPCEHIVSLPKINILLLDVLFSTPDEELKETTGYDAVLKAFLLTPTAEACFGGTDL
jgi:hypothetical protein